MVLVARRAAQLKEIAQTITTQTKCLALDLAAPDAAKTIAEATVDLPVGALVYNAAVAPRGAFLETNLDDPLKALDVNVRTQVELCHTFGKRFVAQGHGGMVLLSSLTAFQGSPYVTTYGATKSFTLSFAEGLWFELKAQGVDVLGVCAGATRTPNFEKAQPNGAPGLLEPDAVVTEALDALPHGPILIPGRFNRFASFALRRLMSRKAAIGIMGNQTKRLT